MYGHVCQCNFVVLFILPVAHNNALHISVCAEMSGCNTAVDLLYKATSNITAQTISCTQIPASPFYYTL